MPKVKLDAAFALAAHCPAGRKKEAYYDTAITGFVLECRQTGGKTYYLRYQDAYGAQRQHKIAAYGDISFDKAKKEAERLRSQVVLGGDPAAKRAEQRAVPTYGELAEQHLAHARTYLKSIDTLEGVIRRIRKRWERVRLTDVHAQDITKWLADLRAQGLAPATVDKVRVTFNRSFELAARWGLPGSDRNPVRGVPRPRFSNARERFITADEAARLLDACSASKNTQLRNIVELLLLTGARVSELLHTEWRNVDLERRAWFIPTSKTGKSRYVPLSQAAVDVIGALPRFKDCGYLLPNPRTRRPFTDLKHPWTTAREAAGLPDLRIHDLRHSAASFMVNAGVDLFAVGKVLGHASYQSTQRYSHLANDTLLKAVEAGAAGLNAKG